MKGEKEILIVPQKPLLKGRLFGTEGIRARETNRPWIELREKMRKKGFELKTIDESSDISGAHAVVFMEAPLPNNLAYKQCLSHNMQPKMRLITYEPRVIHPPNHEPAMHANFRRVLTWNESLLDNEKYFKVNFTFPLLDGEKVCLPRPKFSERKLLCLISSNKYSHRENELYSERVRAIRFMEENHPSEFDLYGVGWNQPVIYSPLASILPINAAIQKFYPRFPFLPSFSAYPSYKGKVADKKGVLPNYKFTISYENEFGAEGYITEKILEAMLCGCVPVYLGDPGIGKRIPKGCFVDKRQYPDYPALYGFLSSMDEGEYEKCVQNMEEFINGKESYPFKIDAFMDSFETLIGE